MNVEIVKYEPDHAYWIIEKKIREHDKWLIDFPSAQAVPLMWAEHPSYTLIIDGEIIMCLGVILTDENIGDAWTLMADDFCKYPIAVFKTCRNILEKIVLEHDLKRVQTFIDAKTPNGDPFIERLGFKEERTFKIFTMDFGG